MTATALRLSRRVNGVAKRHGEVSRALWQPLWPGKAVEDVPIGHVTNGVHVATWMASRMQRLLDKHLGDGWLDRVDQPGFWDRVLELDDQELWSQHLDMKRGLLTYIREEARRRWADRWKEAAHVVGAGTLINPDPLIIGFARRFATYKRAYLLFRGLRPAARDAGESLAAGPADFRGKAHPEDAPGKEVLQRVYTMTRDPRLEGRVAFIEDYEMHLAHRLVQGVDLWLNVPRAPLEACGTSGMKAALNSVPQLSTLDGWWYEGYMGVNGWALPPSEPGDQDAVDAGHLYTLLEEQVIPLYYKRDARGLPVEWLQKMKHALRIAGEKFDARRMVQEYVNQYYVPAASGDLSDPNPRCSPDGPAFSACLDAAGPRRLAGRRRACRRRIRLAGPDRWTRGGGSGPGHEPGALGHSGRRGDSPAPIGAKRGDRTRADGWALHRAGRSAHRRRATLPHSRRPGRAAGLLHRAPLFRPQRPLRRVRR